MDSDASGGLWLVIDVLMVAVLGIALVYGTILWRQRRSRARGQVSERATAQLYEREAERVLVRADVFGVDGVDVAPHVR